MTPQPTPPDALTAHPAAIAAIYLLVFVLTVWGAYQVRHRCEECGSVPVFCSCGD